MRVLHVTQAMKKMLYYEQKKYNMHPSIVNFVENLKELSFKKTDRVYRERNKRPKSASQNDISVKMIKLKGDFTLGGIFALR